MGKNPAFQFYVRDWLSDPSLKQVEFQTKGIWIDLMCYLWESETRGELSGTERSFCRMIGCSEQEFKQFLTDSTDTRFCDISVTDNGIITVRNRRMWRDDKDRRQAALRQKRFRKKQKDNEEVTPPSSSSSSTSKKIYRAKRFNEFWDCYPSIRKTNKKKCLEKWKARKLDDKADMIIADIKNRIKNDRKWIEGFNPAPLTYLNGDRWEDELELKNSSGVNKSNPHFQEIQEITEILKKKQGTPYSLIDKYAEGHNDSSYDAMWSRLAKRLEVLKK